MLGGGETDTCIADTLVPAPGSSPPPKAVDIPVHQRQAAYAKRLRKAWAGQTGPDGLETEAFVFQCIEQDLGDGGIEICTQLAGAVPQSPPSHFVEGRGMASPLTSLRPPPRVDVSEISQVEQPGHRTSLDRRNSNASSMSKGEGSPVSTTKARRRTSLLAGLSNLTPKLARRASENCGQKLGNIIRRTSLSGDGSSIAVSVMKTKAAFKARDAFLKGLSLQPSKKVGKAAPGDDEDNDEAVYNNIQAKLSSVQDPTRQTQKLRYLLQARQIKNPVWAFVMNVFDGKIFNADGGDPKLTLPVSLEVKVEYFRALIGVLQARAETKEFGWMGELPVHVLFLLAYRDGVDEDTRAKTEVLLFLGKLLARLQPSLASAGYRNEIRLYKERERAIHQQGTESAETLEESRAVEDEMGMFTGESVLHIAIMNQDVETVRYLLLQLNSDFSKRAVGVFFRPSIINRLQDDPGPSPARFDERGVQGSDKDRLSASSVPSSALAMSSPHRQEPRFLSDPVKGGGGGGGGLDAFERTQSADGVLAKSSPHPHPLRKMHSEKSPSHRRSQAHESLPLDGRKLSAEEEEQYVIEQTFGVGESASSTDFSTSDGDKRKSSVESLEEAEHPPKPKSRWRRRWEWLRAAIENRNLKAQPLIEVKVNQDSAFFSFGRPELYFGEYPLAFAVYTGNQPVCQALYEAYKVKWNQFGTVKVESIFKQQDLQGNTPFHLAVLHDKKDIFDWLKATEDEDDRQRDQYDKEHAHHDHQDATARSHDTQSRSHDAKTRSLDGPATVGLETLNKDGLTPFTLAARHGRMEMFDHILDAHMTDMIWIYGGLKMTKTSLLQMDTFRVRDNRLHLDTRWRSALEVIVQHEVGAFCGHELFNKLIDDKWSTFARRHYLLKTLLPYLIFIALFTTTVILRCEEVRLDWDAVRGGQRDIDDTGILDYLTNIDSEFSQTSAKLNAARVCGGACLLSCVVLLWEGWRNRRLNATDINPEGDAKFSMSKFGHALHKNLSFLLYLGISGAVSSSMALRVVGYVRTELCLLAVACVLVFCNLLHLVMPLKTVGVLVIMVYRIFIKDVLLCLFVYAILLCAFSMAIFVMFQKSDFPNELNSNRMDFEAFPGASFLQLAWNSLGDGYVDMNLLLQSSQTPSLALVLQLVWVVLSEVLLLNLLIAMMSRTFDDDNRDAHGIWIFPFAYQVLRYEQRLPERAKGRHRSGKSQHTDNDFLTDEQRHTEVYFDAKLQDLRNVAPPPDKPPPPPDAEPQPQPRPAAQEHGGHADAGAAVAVLPGAHGAGRAAHGVQGGWHAMSGAAEGQLHEDLRGLEEKLSKLEGMLANVDKVKESQEGLDRWSREQVGACKEQLHTALLPLQTKLHKCNDKVSALTKERGRLEHRLKSLARTRLQPQALPPVSRSAARLPVRELSLPLTFSPAPGEEGVGPEWFREKARERMRVLDERVRGNLS